MKLHINRWLAPPVTALVLGTALAAGPARDFSAEIVKLEAEVVRSHRLAMPGPWGHLADLYCKQAARQKTWPLPQRCGAKG